MVLLLGLLLNNRKFLFFEKIGFLTSVGAGMMAVLGNSPKIIYPYGATIKGQP